MRLVSLVTLLVASKTADAMCDSYCRNPCEMFASPTDTAVRSSFVVQSLHAQLPLLCA